MFPDPKHIFSGNTGQTRNQNWILHLLRLDPNQPGNGLDQRLGHAQTMKQIRIDQNMACIHSTDKGTWSKPGTRSGLIRKKQCCVSALVSMRIRSLLFISIRIPVFFSIRIRIQGAKPMPAKFDPAFFLIADPDSGSGSRIRIQGLMT
jgi:hypothetical protein